MRLILGTGGSSKAVAWVLQKKGIRFLFVSRKKSGQPDQILYYESESSDHCRNIPS